MTAHAGTLTIYNKNCTKLVWFKQKNHVTVKVYDKMMGCTDTKVNVHKGSRETIWLEPKGDNGRECMYRHRPTGLLGGKADVAGHRNSSVTCERKDADNACWCTKD